MYSHVVILHIVFLDETRHALKLPFNALFNLLMFFVWRHDISNMFVLRGTSPSTEYLSAIKTSNSIMNQQSKSPKVPCIDLLHSLGFDERYSQRFLLCGLPDTGQAGRYRDWVGATTLPGIPLSIFLFNMMKLYNFTNQSRCFHVVSTLVSYVKRWMLYCPSSARKELQRWGDIYNRSHLKVGLKKRLDEYRQSLFSLSN